MKSLMHTDSQSSSFRVTKRWHAIFCMAEMVMIKQLISFSGNLVST